MNASEKSCTGSVMTKADQKPLDETYSEEETVARREAALRRMLATPPKPHKDSKLGKSRKRSDKR
jgi:hypothetical protein